MGVTREGSKASCALAEGSVCRRDGSGSIGHGVNSCFEFHEYE